MDHRPVDQSSISEDYVYFNENLVSWKLETRTLLLDLRAVAKCRTITASTWELIQIKQLPQELIFGDKKI